MDYSPVSQDNASSPNQEIEKVVIKKKSKLETYLPILVPCLAVILILSILAGIWHSKLKDCTKYCKSIDCIITSGEILKLSNLEADPCNDFHEFACGRFQSKAIVKPESDLLMGYSEVFEENLLKMYKLLTDNNFMLKGVNSSAVSKVKSLFSSCMDVRNIEMRGKEPLLQFIDRMKGWPLLGDSKWNESTWLLNDALSFSNKLRVFPFFKYEVLPSFYNSSEFEIKFSGVDLSYEKSVYEKSEAERLSYKQSLINYICSVAELLGATQNFTEEAEEIWNLEENIGKILASSYPQTELFTINRTTIAMANVMLGDWINLENFLSEVFGQAILSSDKITVASDKYLEDVGELIKKTNKRTQANYIMWINIKELIPFLSDSFKSAERMFNKVSAGQVAPKPQWKACITFTIDSMGFALSALFIEEYFVETAKHQVEEIFNSIKEVFEKKLKSVSWLDEQTRSEALKKIKKLKKRIGYPDFIKDPHLLDDYYYKLAITNDYFGNALNIATFESYKDISKYGKQRDKQEWIISPVHFNAYYDRSANEMVLLAGLLQKPIFSEDFPKSFNFGRVGFIIGHEIIHGFDSLGRQFNSDGNVVNWWSNMAESEFNKKSACFVKKYSSFSVFGRNTSGLRTLPEDIADNGGLSLAYLGYKEWLKNNKDLLLPGIGLTHEQQFFLSFGQYFCTRYREKKAIEMLSTDNHSNNKIRIIGTVQNSDQFADAFRCKKNSAMNPQKKCSIW